MLEDVKKELGGGSFKRRLATVLSSIRWQMMQRMLMITLELSRVMDMVDKSKLT